MRWVLKGIPIWVMRKALALHWHNSFEVSVGTGNESYGSKVVNCIFSLWLDLLVNQSRLEKPRSSWVSAWLRTLSAFSSVPKAASVFGSLLGLLIAINWCCWAEKSVWKAISTFWVTLLCKRHGAFRSIAYYRRGLSSGSFNGLLGLTAYWYELPGWSCR